MSFVLRIIVGVGIPVFLLFEFLFGISAYSTGLQSDGETVYGWDAVKVMCLYWVPGLFFFTVLVIVGVSMGLVWALDGGKKR